MTLKKNSEKILFLIFLINNILNKKAKDKLLYLFLNTELTYSGFKSLAVNLKNKNLIDYYYDSVENQTVFVLTKNGINFLLEKFILIEDIFYKNEKWKHFLILQTLNKSIDFPLFFKQRILKINKYSYLFFIKKSFFQIFKPLDNNLILPISDLKSFEVFFNKSLDSMEGVGVIYKQNLDALNNKKEPRKNTKQYSRLFNENFNLFKSLNFMFTIEPSIYRFEILKVFNLFLTVLRNVI